MFQHPSLNEFIQQALEPTKPLDLKLVLEDLLVHLSLSKEIYFDGRLISTTVREEMATSIDHALKRGSASIEA